MYVYVGAGLRRSFAMPDPFVLTNKICLNQQYNKKNSKTFIWCIIIIALFVSRIN